MTNLDMSIEELETIVAPCDDDQFMYFWTGVATGATLIGLGIALFT